MTLQHSTGPHTIVPGSGCENGPEFAVKFQIGLEKTQTSHSTEKGDVEGKFFLFDRLGKRQKWMVD